MNLEHGYIAIEGIDGAGSTTQRDMLATRLVVQIAPRVVLSTAQPTQGEIGRIIREMLTGKRPMVDPVAFQLLFTADRLGYGSRVVKPHLDAGGIVVSDRCEMSTAVYLAGRAPLFQCGKCDHVFDDLRDIGLPAIRTTPITCPTCASSHVHHLGLDEALAALTWNDRSLHPGLMIVVDVPVSVAAERRKARGGPEETFDSDLFQRRARRLYLAEAWMAYYGARLVEEDGTLPEMRRMAVVDGTKPPDEVHAAVWAIVEQYLTAVGLR